MTSINIIKKDGRSDEFNSSKIERAIIGAATELKYNLKKEVIDFLTQKAVSEVEDLGKKNVTVEEVHAAVEYVLENEGHGNVKEAYRAYRLERNNIREQKSELMKTVAKIGVETDRDNANVGNNFSSKLLRISSETNKIHNLAIMPKYLAKEHEQGNLYYHDLDSYNLTTNCLHLDTRDILKRGFNTGYGSIKPPKRIESAAELSCILLQSTQNDMFGGQSHVDFDNAMGEFIPLTREEIRSELESYRLEREELEAALSAKIRKAVWQSAQGVVYNLNTMHSRAGSQVPFSSTNIGLPENDDAAMFCEAFLDEYAKGLGKHEQPIFPNIIFRVKDGVNKNPEDPYFNLYKKACEVAAKRMNPTFMNMDAPHNKKYYDKGIKPAIMGCRTYICSNVNGEEGPAGRGNIAPTTLNLPRIGILAHGDIDRFFTLLNEKLTLAKESLLHRYSVLKNLRVKDLPFVAGQGMMKGTEGLDPNDSIEPILKMGTWGIGFIGLAETLYALVGKHHGQATEVAELALKIVRTIREFTDKTTEETQLNWSCYATPAEGLSGKFIKQDQKKFGTIKGVTDKDYYTNSFHVPVGYQISIKEKIDIEAPFHELCNGGHISYIELDDYPEAEDIMDIVNYAFTKTNMGYIGINFHIRFCKDCGTYLHSGEQKCTCGSTNIQGVSRVTGYLSLDERFGAGKHAERADRLTHGDEHHNNYQLV